MRVDLLLQKPQVGFAHLSLILFDLRHKSFQTLCHQIHTVRQNSHLILRLHLRSCREISFRHLLRHSGKNSDRPYDVRHNHHNQNCHHKNQQGEKYAAEYSKAVHLHVQLVRQILHAFRLIIDIRLNIILNQLCQDINIIVKHLDIDIIPHIRLQIRPNVIHAILQCVNIAQKNL